MKFYAAGDAGVLAVTAAANAVSFAASVVCKSVNDCNCAGVAPAAVAAANAAANAAASP